MTTSDDLDAFARDYYLADPLGDTWLEERVQAWLLPKLAGWCRGSVLEMGWGTGLVTCGLINAGVGWLSVVEGSALLVEQAREDAPDATVHHARFEDFDPPEPYDTVICAHVLEHVDDPLDLLRRVRTWLKPGGRLIVIVPNADSLHRRVGELMTGEPRETLSDRDRLVGHRRVFTMEDDIGEDPSRNLVGTLMEAGFEPDHGATTYYGAFGFFAKPVPNSLMLGWAPELIDALCEIGWEGFPRDAANIGCIVTAP